MVPQKAAHFFYLILPFLFTCTIPEPLQAQEHRASVEFIQTFRSIQEDLPRERIYLHTDRQWYLFGDRIWFSAYVVAGSYRFPSQISSLLYVELIEPDGTMAERVPVKLTGGFGSGSLTFANAKENPGIYTIRAYTAWSLNFGASYEFTSDITVYTDGELTSAPPQGDMDLQFMPESGYLIDGLTTTIGFKAVGRDGYGIDVSGVIRDKNSNVEIPFSSEHRGMGVVEPFTPGLGASYTAVVDGVHYELPEVQSSGYLLHINQSPSQFQIEIQSKGVETGDALLLFAHVRGEIFYASLVLMDEGQGGTAIPKEQFPTGVVHFTLLDPLGYPVAERLTFNKSSLDETAIELELDREIYTLRDETALTVRVRDFESNPLPARISLSVFDDDLFDYHPYYTDINSHLNLETELKGYVEAPGFYFSGHEQAGRALDILLLTQGWRAYDMNQIASLEEIRLFSFPETGITVSGFVKSGFRGRPLEDATVVFSFGPGGEEVQLSTTDADGRFVLGDLQIEGGDLINIRANDASGSDRVRIELEEQFSNLPEYSSPLRGLRPRAAEDTEAGSARGELAGRAETARMEVERFVDAQMVGELEEITVTAERMEQVDDFERNLRFRGDRTSQRINFDERPALASLPFVEAINQIPGVSANRNSGLSIETGFVNLGGSSPPPPLIIIDDIEAEFSDLVDLTPADVQTVNVFRRSAELGFFGARGAGGVLVVRTRRGDGGSTANQRGLITARVQGYQPATQFYSPRYGITVPRDIEQPDNRITLHWDADFVVPEEGQTIRFWTNDIPSAYRIVVQGLTQNGLPFSATKTFTVEQP
ncbi:MAG: carboxypeptidase regulatory-like domain-containing protein [Balneolaceae bacterium]|nr:MAG: carboxypeptidase regulatory-like domain-containing protein [Balneolaceae bacterium]